MENVLVRGRMGKRDGGLNYSNSSTNGKKWIRTVELESACPCSSLLGPLMISRADLDLSRSRANPHGNNFVSGSNWWVMGKWFLPPDLLSFPQPNRCPKAGLGPLGGCTLVLRWQLTLTCSGTTLGGTCLQAPGPNFPFPLSSIDEFLSWFLLQVTDPWESW